MGDGAFDGHESLTQIFVDGCNAGSVRHGRVYDWPFELLSQSSASGGEDRMGWSAGGIKKGMRLRRERDCITRGLLMAEVDP